MAVLIIWFSVWKGFLFQTHSCRSLYLWVMNVVKWENFSRTIHYPFAIHTQKRNTPGNPRILFFFVCDHNHPPSECGVLREKSIIKMSLLDDLFFREELKVMQEKKVEEKFSESFLILEVLMGWECPELGCEIVEEIVEMHRWNLLEFCQRLMEKSDLNHA